MSHRMGGQDSSLGARLVAKEAMKVTNSLEQKIEVLETTIKIYEHAFEMIGLDIRQAEKALNNLKGD